LFRPAVRNREAVPIVVTLLMQFRLSDAKQAAGVQQSSLSGAQPLTDDFANGAYWIGTAGLTAPVLTAMAEPKYTAQAMRDKIQGDVVVELIVMPDGSVGKARVAISLDPNDGLDDNALAAAQQYRFTPGVLNGRAVPVLVSIALNFRLH
jgi:protein TonB